MGNLEKEVKKKIRATKIQKAILAVIANAGLLTVAALAPNVLQSLQTFGLIPKTKRDKNHSINMSRDRLLKAGLIKYSEEHYLCLTSAGEKVLKKFEFSNYNIVKPKRWDGKWRMLIFDIKEYHKPIREKVRNTLISIGFMKLQNSVWVYPYDCEDLITLIKADLAVGKEVLYVIADKIENDKNMLTYFGLKR
jgi:CRISPR-associated endonuclease Cas2